MCPEAGRTPGQSLKLAVLLIDDDVELCALMSEYFARRGIALECAHNGRDGLAQALRQEHDVIILDGMLPILDGFEVLRQLRRRSAVPVLMLTARAQERDRIAGLDSGADDYLPKPFAPDELSARIRAVLRRYQGAAQTRPEILRCGPVELHTATGAVRRDGVAISLTTLESQILELLMRSAGRVVSRDEITAVLHRREASPFERSIDVHLSHLRKKIDAGQEPVIHTVRGVGYMVAAGELPP